MSWTTPRTWVMGETVTAAILNLAIRDNLNALWTGTTNGDIEYYTSGTSKSRLGIGSSGQVLSVVSGVPAWADAGGVYRRKGGSATVWSTPGNTSYTPSGSKMQVGAVSITMSGSPAYGSAAITFPVAFTYAPLIYLTLCSASGGFSSGVWTQLEPTSITNTGFTINICQNANDANYNPRTVNWQAIGV